MPLNPLTNTEINYFLNEFSSCDANNFSKSGLGEREGRIFSPIVQNRHFGFAHGIGRSGDLLEAQPKAAGSFQMLQITEGMVLLSLKLAGFQTVKKCLMVPVCTGMSFFFVLTALKLKRVIWLRCDQKSVPKALELGADIVEVVDCIVQDDSMVSDYEKLQQLMESRQFDCVISTTSCFAPRQPDDIKIIGKLAKLNNMKHIVNNAYGIQSELIMRELNNCEDAHVVISSMDKNYMVPVSGALIYSRNKPLIQQIGQLYAGRASASGIIDLFITLLSLGQSGWNQVLEQRKRNFNNLKLKFKAKTVNRNEISMYVPGTNEEIGKLMFKSGISGSRFNKNGSELKICGRVLKDFGLHGEGGISGYLVVAAAIGMKENEVDAGFLEYEQQ
ncbi:O-phosphoseryl-tRNA(Sec)_selenium transferase [Hexamita inflata]|uniref:O-phosphoseryl-tRNA(Sec) selenium transferase n=1 Tax=Hexamita inflata TaxID=28002 RepID=A0ABP1GFK0_9EUKA